MNQKLIGWGEGVKESQEGRGGKKGEGGVSVSDTGALFGTYLQ